MSELRRARTSSGGVERQRRLLCVLTFHLVALTTAGMAAAQDSLFTPVTPPASPVPFAVRPRMPRQGSLIVLRVTPRSTQNGDSVVAVGHSHGTVKANGNSFDIAIVHVWHLRDGKAVLFEPYVDTAGMLKALGK